MQAQYEQRQVQEVQQIHIEDPASEPSQLQQAALEMEPTVVPVPASPAATSPAVASSPESVGMRIPAALRWSLSPRSNARNSSPGRPSEDGQGQQQGSGGKLLQRLRTAARRAVRSPPLGILARVAPVTAA